MGCRLLITWLFKVVCTSHTTRVYEKVAHREQIKDLSFTKTQKVAELA